MATTDDELLELMTRKDAHDLLELLAARSDITIAVLALLLRELPESRRNMMLAALRGFAEGRDPLIEQAAHLESVVQSLMAVKQ